MKSSITNKLSVIIFLLFLPCFLFMTGCTLEPAKDIQKEISQREDDVRNLERKLKEIENVKNDVARLQNEIEKLEKKKARMLELHPELKKPFKRIKLK